MEEVGVRARRVCQWDAGEVRKFFAVQLWPKQRIFIAQETVLAEVHVPEQETRLRDPSRVRGRHDPPLFEGVEAAAVPEVRQTIEVAVLCKRSVGNERFPLEVNAHHLLRRTGPPQTSLWAVGKMHHRLGPTPDHHLQRSLGRRSPTGTLMTFERETTTKTTWQNWTVHLNRCLEERLV